ncbi:Endo-1,4-beta-xylanase [Bertholletia excelsa]
MAAAPAASCYLLPPCLAEPHKPQYGGGLVVNPQLDDGLKGWDSFGYAKVKHRISETGNSFVVAHGRQHPHASFSQKFLLDKDKLYTLSAWLQVNKGSAEIAARFKTPTGWEPAGWVIAQSGCWSMLKGGLVVNASGPSYLYFESNNTEVEIWADSVSLQPFTQEEWRSHQLQSIDKVRKSITKLQAMDAAGNPLANATVSIKQLNSGFPFGCAINSIILSNNEYQNWFTSRFGGQVTVFENEMKWYSTEQTQGREDYSVADAMLNFAKNNGMTVRGHSVLWDDPSYQVSWVPSLSNPNLQAAVDKHINSVVNRYKGQLIAWDVENENVHFNFFESRLGPDAGADFYNHVHEIDGGTMLFLNEFNTIEEPSDAAVTPPKYLAKIKNIQSKYNGPLAVGLQGHFKTPNIPYMRSAIDQMASAGLPIWLTEVDVAAGNNQANYLEQVLREGHSHPKVNGIVLWSAWKSSGCYQMCLTDNNFKNLPTGDVVDKLLREFGGASILATTDALGRLNVPLFHGDYEVTVSHPDGKTTSEVHSFKVDSTAESESTKEEVIHVKVAP